MSYLNKFIKILIVMLIIVGFYNHDVSAMPYYDLRFEEVSSKVAKGGYENLNGNINLNEDTKIPMLITKSYEPKVSVEINKDEEDAISQELGYNWNEWVVINKQEDINIKKNENTYIQVRPLYKEINGILIKDYNSWTKKKNITILIPIDVEYTLKIN